MSDYKHTLNLPKTSFAMKANLIQREPEMLKFWSKIDAAKAMVAASGSRGTWVLHDGPPYANGHIHMGTALNKILKDIVVKSHNMQGYACEYVPGWDCHGLPIEHKVEQELKAKRKNLPPLTVRKLCREYAQKWIKIQKQEFIRLGVLGDWDNPYLSMLPAYEAATASNLAEFVARGGVVRAKKPIYWCSSCQTALAEAEVEYGDETSPSIYVAFAINDQKLKNIFPQAENASVIIWTTTPWTLPSNLAVSLHPEYEYALVQVGDKQYIVAKDLLQSVATALNWTAWEIIATAPGRNLENIQASHPFYDHHSPLILGTHVTLDAGTGCVHTAPGHGREDYEVGLKYGLEVLAPLDDTGHFLPSVPLFGGMEINAANQAIIETLRQNGALLGSGKIRHSYPHCWRCKKPVIFRATTQWFISMEANGLRQKALNAIDNDVRWIPAWGRDRIYNMIESRPDWCISRQRQWGVPIIALKCGHCGAAWNDPAWMRKICARFATHPTGCDFWYEAPLEEIVPPGLKCPECGENNWQKETDILDVWFDSGTSFAAVLQERPNLSFPADLYLEGSDQHRGWFHSSLLIAEGVHDQAPYKAVLTHGYVVDGEGHKMSKSIGNVIAPQELIDKFGAEIIRLWVSSVDYQEDIRISDEILKRLVDAYRRIRNTCRFILGNIHDLTPDTLVPVEQLLPLDRFSLDNAARLHKELQQAYLDFEFHKVFHCIHKYCITDLSAFYMDIVKDRLYVTGANSKERRSTQTALWRILLLLLRDLAPILSFTAEEIFSHLPQNLKGPEVTVFALQPQDTDDIMLDDAKRDDWQFLLAVRGAINHATEPLRQAGEIGHSLDTAVTVYADDDARERLESLCADLKEIFIVSQFAFRPFAEAPTTAVQDTEAPGIAIVVGKAQGEKCARCWTYSTELGQNPQWPDVCPRCAKVLAGA